MAITTSSCFANSQIQASRGGAGRSKFLALSPSLVYICSCFSSSAQEETYGALSPLIQHILQFLFLLLLFLAFVPKIYSKFVNLRWPQPRSSSPRKRPE